MGQEGVGLTRLEALGAEVELTQWALEEVVGLILVALVGVEEPHCLAWVEVVGLIALVAEEHFLVVEEVAAEHCLMVEEAVVEHCPMVKEAAVEHLKMVAEVGEVRL